MSKAPIRAKVARILNSREIVITAGFNLGVENGMYFDVIAPDNESIIDPDTGEDLGSVERSKVRVQIVEVKEKLSVASTYRKNKVNVGGEGLGGLSALLGNWTNPPKYVTRYQTLKTNEGSWEALPESKSYVQRGDPVVQVINPTED